MKTILVTGSAGFIGSNLVKELLKTNEEISIIGFDSVNDYYDVSIKEYRLAEIEKLAESKPKCKYTFIKGNLADKALIEKIFTENKIDIVVNLAAQAGVRYSITNPDAYIESNIIGFYNILEACRNHPVEHLVYASSSSVYGGNKKVPFSTDDKVDNPVSLYAATKKSNELMAHAYSKLYNIPSTGLRFFTVYGPAGRPDMAYFGFTNKLVNNETIKIFNYGNCKRDFTYVDDIVDGIISAINYNDTPYEIINLGGGAPVSLNEMISTIEKVLNKKATIEHLPMQLGDVSKTAADITKAKKLLNYNPKTSFKEGIIKFIEWEKSNGI